MKKDFGPNGEKPLWPLSVYGPAKHEPNLSPSLDESPEELRIRAVQAKAANTIPDYVRYCPSIVTRSHPQLGEL